VNDNRGGSIERVITRGFSETFAQTENWGNNVGAEITVGTSFSTGVPFIAEGEISMEVSASYEHEWGRETYREITYSTEVNCRAPPRTRVECRYITN